MPPSSAASSAEQIAIVVAILIVFALVLALVIRALVARKKRAPPAPTQLSVPPARETLEGPQAKGAPAIPAVVFPPPAGRQARQARQERARAELAEAEAALAAALAAPVGSTARAEAAQRTRAVSDARGRVEYESRKFSEAEEKARTRAEAEAEKAAQARAHAVEEARVAAEKAEELAAQERLAELQSGRTLAEGLAKTRGGFMARLNALFGGGKELDEAALGELEEILFSADVGVRTATRLLESVRERLKRKELSDLSKVKGALREEIERILSLDGAGMASAGHGGLPALPAGVPPPQVVMVVGVNGTGKTTTIGKLAARLKLGGQSVLLGAGDTFRAAASEQLDVWAERAQAPIVRGKDGSDPGAVLFDAVTKAKLEGVQIVLCDTAGRLHTKAGLMDELKRLRRTIEKAHAGAPHEVLLVVDATTGQNAIAQARQFHESLGVTGFVLTKLDGTAKGGVIIGICDELKLPVRYVGVGEKVADLKPFDAHEFVEALFS